jgi:hypothetical protein
LTLAAGSGICSIVPERRDRLGRQRRNYLQAMAAADQKVTAWSATFENAAPEPDDRSEIHGDRATVADHYRVRWTGGRPAASWARGALRR